MKRRRLAFGGSMCACQPLGNPRSPALFGQRMGKARDEGRLFGTDRPLPGSLPRAGAWAKNGGWSIWQYTSNLRIAGDGVDALDGDIATKDAWTPRK